MSSLGTYLKEMRNKCHLSLKDVQEQCGVTDSKLSRLERGEGKILAPHELKRLAQLYGIGIVPLYIMAGYLDKNDLSAYQLVFDKSGGNSSLTKIQFHTENQAIDYQLYIGSGNYKKTETKSLHTP